MPLYMIHKTFEGEPVGIHSEDGTYYYAPGNTALERKGKGWVNDRPKSFPWKSFVDIHSGRFTHRDSWDSLDSELSMEQALDVLRGQYTDARASE